MTKRDKERGGPGNQDQDQDQDQDLWLRAVALKAAIDAKIAKAELLSMMAHSADDPEKKKELVIDLLPLVHEIETLAEKLEAMADEVQAEEEEEEEGKNE